MDVVVVVYEHVCCCYTCILHGDLLVYRDDMFMCIGVGGRLGYVVMMLFVLFVVMFLVLL